MAALLQEHSNDRIVNGYEPNERAWMVFINMKKYVRFVSILIVMDTFKKILIVSLEQITLWRFPDQQKVGINSRSLHLQRGKQVLLQRG